MATDDFTYDLVSGDWLYDADRDGYQRVYEGVVTGGWSGGVEFVVSRSVADQIVRDQEGFVREQVEAFGTDSASDIPALRWDGDVLVLSGGGDDESRYGPVDPQGNYEIGFGWIWARVEDDDRFFEVVRHDGTVEQNEIDHETRTEEKS